MKLAVHQNNRTGDVELPGPHRDGPSKLNAVPESLDGSNYEPPSDAPKNATLLSTNTSPQVLAAPSPRSFKASRKNEADLVPRQNTAVRRACLVAATACTAATFYVTRTHLSVPAALGLAGAQMAVSAGFALAMGHIISHRGIVFSESASHGTLVSSLLVGDLNERDRRNFRTALPEEADQFIHRAHDRLGNYARMRRAYGLESTPEPSSMFLYGPPGSGKSSLVRTLGWECKYPVLRVKGSSVKSAWFGESDKAIEDLCHQVENFAKFINAPVILFLDEADDLLGRRTGGAAPGYKTTDSVVSNFLLALDKLASARPAVHIILATNFPNGVDSAVTDRIDETIFMDLPHREDVIQYFRTRTCNNYYSKESPWLTEKAADIAARCDGFSYRDLDTILPRSRNIAAFAERESIAMEDVLRAIEKVREKRGERPKTIRFQTLSRAVLRR